LKGPGTGGGGGQHRWGFTKGEVSREELGKALVDVHSGFRVGGVVEIKGCLSSLISREDHPRKQSGDVSSTKYLPREKY